MNTLRADDLQAFFNECGKNGNQARKGGLAPKTLTNLRNMMHMALQCFHIGFGIRLFLESLRFSLSIQLVLGYPTLVFGLV